MTLTVYEELSQGTPEWLDARCGILTASVIGQLVSSRQPTAIEADCPDCGAVASEPCIGKRSPAPLKTLHPARAAVARTMPRVISADLESETARGLILNLAAERITGYVEPMRETDDMRRGTLDEPFARDKYAEHYAPVDELGFMIREFDGFKLGYSPDGLVGDNGLIEIKSRKQKIQLRTVLADEVPVENMAQIQTGLLVSGREWCDYVSYSGGMKLYVKRVHPNPAWHTAILEAAKAFETAATQMIDTYLTRTADAPMTERIDHYLDLELKL